MKIANKISFVFLILSTLLTIIASSIFYLVSKVNIQNAIYEQLVIDLEENAQNIRTYLDLLKISIAQLSKSITLEDLLKEQKKNPQKVSKKLLDLAMKRLKRTKESNPAVYEFMLLNAGGKVIASSDKNSIGSDKSMDAYFLGGQKDIFIKDAYHSRTVEENLMAISGPILDSNTDEFLGVLVARVRMDELNKITKESYSMGRTRELYIVNKYGYMITPSRFLKNTFLKQRIDTDNFRNCLAHRNPSVSNNNHIELPMISLNYRGVKVLGEHVYLPQMQWAILAEIDEQDAFAPLARVWLIFLFILFLVPILAFLLGRYLAKIIALPIVKLHRGTEIIGEGNLDYKVGVNTKDEIGQLSRAFDTMTKHLKTTTTSVGKLNQEIAQRKRIQEGLKQATEEWQKTFDSIGDLIFIQDKDFNIIKMNRACLDALGLKLDQVLGRKCFEVLHHLEHPWPNCPFKKTLADSKLHTEEVDDPGLGVPLLITTSPIFDERGELSGSVHIARDISQIKKYQKELEDKNKEFMKLDALKSEFVSVVSHELRTPLSIIKEGISLVLDQIPGETNPKQDKILNTSKDNIDRLARIINNLLDISKIETGKIELSKRLVDINDLVKKAISIFDLKMKERGLEAKLNLPDGRLDILIDEDRIFEVLVNLLGNSLKFTKEGYISVEIVDKGKEIECIVADSGIGIHNENISKLFSKFIQFGRINGGGERGTGLGLSIAKGLIDLHGGKIWVESEFGKGTQVHFTLPK